MYMGRKKVLQSQFINIQEAMTISEDGHEETTVQSVTTLDSWYVAVKGHIKVLVDLSQAHAAVYHFGLKTNPTTLVGLWALTGTVGYDDLLEDYLDLDLDGFVAFGSSIKMPLFYLLMQDDLFAANDIITFKKIFRKGVYSGDKLVMYQGYRTLDGVKDTEGQYEVKAQIKQVIAPNRW